jgi:hypothetical protein
LYSDHPADEPGNDDLGAISSWYVWAAIGLFPVTPGTADLALASPLFPRTVVTLPDQRTLTLTAPAASASRPYIHSLTVQAPKLVVASSACPGGPATSATWRGGRWSRPWLPSSILKTGGTLSYDLSATPDRSWGAAPADGPPSYATGRLPAVGYSAPSGGTTLHVGQPSTIEIGVKEISGGGTPVRWSAAAVSGLTLSADSGVLTPPAAVGCASPPGVTQALTVEATGPGTFPLVVNLKTANGTALAPVVLDVKASN